MTRWEYMFIDIAGVEVYRSYSSDTDERRDPHVIDDDVVADVNAMGADGWEPFAVADGYLHLRRQAPRAPERRSGDPL
jgi:hypothetical protein